MLEKLEKRKQDFDAAYDLLIGEKATAALDSAKNAFDDALEAYFDSVSLDSAKNAFDDALEAYFDNVSLDESDEEDEKAKKDSTEKKKGE